MMDCSLGDRYEMPKYLCNGAMSAEVGTLWENPSSWLVAPSPSVD